jgi:hypothetical protein
MTKTISAENSPDLYPTSTSSSACPSCGVELLNRPQSWFRDRLPGYRFLVFHGKLTLDAQFADV